MCPQMQEHHVSCGDYIHCNRYYTALHKQCIIMYTNCIVPPTPSGFVLCITPCVFPVYLDQEGTVVHFALLYGTT